MTGKQLLNKLIEMDKCGNIDVPIAIRHLYLDITGIYLSHSTDGKVPYINIQTKEELKILDFD